VSDLDAMMSLDSLVSASPWSRQSLARYCEPAPADSHCAFVCEVSLSFSGFLIYSRLLDEANIDNVAVSPHYQGRGFGRALLLTALKRCMLEVRESNVAARALYENNGFVIDGVRPQYYKTQQGREDALLMSRRL
jgi:ribosomal-protein-alanine N-acetyltransferase